MSAPRSRDGSEADAETLGAERQGVAKRFEVVYNKRLTPAKVAVGSSLNMIDQVICVGFGIDGQVSPTTIDVEVQE